MLYILPVTTGYKLSMRCYCQSYLSIVSRRPSLRTKDKISITPFTKMSGLPFINSLIYRQDCYKVNKKCFYGAIFKWFL